MQSANASATAPGPLPPLDIFFRPRSVAVVGASETVGSVGRAVLWNIVSNPFGGTVFPISKQPSVLGIKAYQSVRDIPMPVDVAIIATGPEQMLDAVGACADGGVRGAIVVPGNLRRYGPDSVAVEQQLVQRAHRAGMRMIGPNSLGLLRPVTGLNISAAEVSARRGKLAFVSQSGALCNAVLDWGLREQIGFSACISIGSMLDVGWGEAIDYLGDDEHTSAIVIYMESIGDARSFMSAAREVALTKPIIVLKSGTSNESARLDEFSATSDAALDAAFSRCGVLRVGSLAEMFAIAETLAKQPRPRGPRLTIVSNAGGPAVLAVDTLVAEQGQLAQLPPDTINGLNDVLGTNWSHANPIDIYDSANPKRYLAVTELAAQNPDSDGVLVILTPQPATNALETAQLFAASPVLSKKLLLTSWMGGKSVIEAEEVLNRANFSTFNFPDEATQAFVAMWRYSDNLRALYETPTLTADLATGSLDRATVQRIVAEALSNDHASLSEADSKHLLAAYGLPVVDTMIAIDDIEAVAYADAIGYPVVLKLHSHTITHKTDVGGVRLNLPDAHAVRVAFHAIRASVAARAGAGHFAGVTVQPMVIERGYELRVGAYADPKIGPVLMFGAGGLHADALGDYAIGLPPLNTTLARRMIERTRVWSALRMAYKDNDAILSALEQTLVRLSWLVAEQPRVRTIDINPLLISRTRLLALDAHIVLYDAATSDDELPHTAVRPYPVQYVATWQAKDGNPILFRPIRPEDEPMMVEFHRHVSDQSIYYRFFSMMKYSQRVSHERLTRICFIDYTREIALVAERTDENGKPYILGVGRLSWARGVPEAEFSLLIGDTFQGLGLGTELLSRLVQIGRTEGLRRITGYILAENSAMLHVARKVGFRQLALGDPVEVVIKLDTPGA